MPSPSPRRGSPRKDPAHRHTDGLSPWNQVVNPQPGYHYVLVSPDAKENGPEYYSAMGYDYVTFDATKNEAGKATKLGAGKWKDGEQVQAFGQFLMCVDRDRYDDIQLNGAFGGSGQLATDRIMATMADRRRGGADPLGNNGSILAQTWASNNDREAAETDLFLRT